MKRVVLPLVIVLTLLSFLGFIFLQSRSPSTDTTVRSFVVNQGDDIITIGQRLAKNNFIRSPLSFWFWSIVDGQSRSIKAGGFRLSPSYDVREVLTRLTQGGSQDYWFRIIPGQRLAEINLTVSTDKEGYLFPDSYLIPEYYTNDEIVTLVEKNFDQKIESVRSNSSKLSLSEVVTLASLLEREAKTRSDKQMVAGVIQNRIRLGMPLQIDAAVQYARDTITPPIKYWTPLTKPDLKINSPYNTYLSRGLPPTPICNPGLDSLYAAYHPTSSDYLFYISDNSGTLHFARTLAEHNALIAKYLK